MDYQKIGSTIKRLRTEKNMTQKDIAQHLHITEQAVSKWERGIGLPDISVCAHLADFLGIDLETLFHGNLEENEDITTNMKDLLYHICPTCGNVIVSAAPFNGACCGRPLTPITPQKATAEEALTVTQVEDEWFITTDHPMTKENYIHFTAFAMGERIEVVKHYPEWNLTLRIPKRRHGRLLWYTPQEGLKYQLI